MNTEDKESIRQRAYAIWEQEGRPDGRHEEHWQRASDEMRGLEDAPKSARKQAPLAPAGKQAEKAQKRSASSAAARTPPSG